MTLDRSLTTTPIRSQAEITLSFFDDFDVRITDIRDQDRLASLNAVLSELRSSSEHHREMAQYHYLHRILSDITNFSSQQYSGPRPKKTTANAMRGDSRQLKLRYALLHYATMHRIAHRTSAQLCDEYRIFYLDSMQTQIEAIISLAPVWHRVEWIRKVATEAQYLSSQAIDDLVAQATVPPSPTKKVGWASRWSRRRVKSP